MSELLFVMRMCDLYVYVCWNVWWWCSYLIALMSDGFERRAELFRYRWWTVYLVRFTLKRIFNNIICICNCLYIDQYEDDKCNILTTHVSLCGVVTRFQNSKISNSVFRFSFLNQKFFSPTKKIKGRSKNAISLAQLFRVKKLIDPENTQCESFPTSEESNGNLIRMLYRQYQSDREKCQESVKRELNETILRDMPKQILDEYKMSCEDVETKKITEQATNEENNDEVEEVENKEEEIELIENDNTKWHARTFPYPRPANFELGIQEFLKMGKKTISKIPGGYLSGSEKSHRMFCFVSYSLTMKVNSHI